MMKLTHLTPEICDELGPRICEADKVDCIAHDFDAGAALHACREGGLACAVLDGDIVVGALGWTYEGYIWSLWADLTFGQAKFILKKTPEMVLQIASHARRPLCNVVWEGNDRTIRWLKASGCFEFIDTERLAYKDKVFLPFFVKPLGDLACVIH